MSTYETSCPHKLIYSQQSYTELFSELVEKTIFNILDKFRQSANRELFELPEDKTIDLFINVIKNQLAGYKLV